MYIFLEYIKSAHILIFLAYLYSQSLGIVYTQTYVFQEIFMQRAGFYSANDISSLQVFFINGQAVFAYY